MPIRGKRMIPIRSKDEIILASILGEILFGVVNDVICAYRARHLQIPRAAHGSHFRSKRLGNLHCKRTHPARRSVDQNFLPWLNMPLIAQALQGSEGCRGHSRSFLK